MKVDLYTTHCPKCSVLEKKLVAKNIEYTEHTDVEEMLKMGFKAAPVLIVDNRTMNYLDAVNWVKTFNNTECEECKLM